MFVNYDTWIKSWINIIWHPKCIPWQLCIYTGKVSSMFQRYAFVYLFIQNSYKHLNCVKFQDIKLYYSSIYPFNVQTESDYTCVDLSHEVYFEDFSSKTYWLSKSITDRPWRLLLFFLKWAPVLNQLNPWFKRKKNVFYTPKKMHWRY